MRVGPLDSKDSARLFVHKVSRPIDPAELGVEAPCELIDALAHHSLVGFMKGHPGTIVHCAAMLEEHDSIGDLELALKTVND